LLQGREAVSVNPPLVCQCENDMTELCLEEGIEIPGLAPEYQSPEQPPRQIGKVLGAMFKEKEELMIDGFRAAQKQVICKRLIDIDTI